MFSMLAFPMTYANLILNDFSFCNYRWYAARQSIRSVLYQRICFFQPNEIKPKVSYITIPKIFEFY